MDSGSISSFARAAVLAAGPEVSEYMPCWETHFTESAYCSCRGTPADYRGAVSFWEK